MKKSGKGNKFKNQGNVPVKADMAINILNLFTAIIVLIIYILIIRAFYFDTDFIKLLFLNGLNYLALSFFRFLLILPVPLVIKYVYDSFKKIMG